jgi:hypothetical protein
MLGEHMEKLRNMLGTQCVFEWEHNWQQQKSKKIQHPSPPPHSPKEKKKQTEFHKCMLIHLIKCKEILCPPLFFINFLLAYAKEWQGHLTMAVNFSN